MAQLRRQLVFASLFFTGLVGVSLTPAALAEGDAWTPRAPMPTPRRLLAAAAEDGKIYTFGGCGSPCFEPPIHSSTDEETRVEVYDPDRNAWQVKRPMSAILFGAAAAAPGNGKIYTFGGYVTPNLTQEYTPATDSWRKRPPMPTPRHGHAAVAFAGKVYVLGGSNGNSASNALEIYDPAMDTWTAGPPMPTARVFLAAAVLNGKIFAIGGSPDCCGKSQTAAVEIYDPDPRQNRWTTGASLPIALQTSAAASVNGKIYVFGGFIPGAGVQNATFEYDPATSSWSTKTPMTTARDQAPAVVVDGLVYVVGGSVHCHCTALGENEEYEPEGSRELTCTKDGPSSVEAGAAVTYEITVRNEGSAAATGVMVTDPTPAGLLSEGPVCTAASPCPLGTIGPGDSKSLQVKFRAPACPTERLVTNIATVSAENAAPSQCPPFKTAIVVQPKVTCSKTQSGSADDVISYDVTVRNPRCTAVRNVMLDDPAPAGLTLAGVGPPCTKLPCDLGTVRSGQSLPPINVRFRVPKCSEPFVNTAMVSGTNTAQEKCSFETILIPDLAVDVSFPAVVSPPAPFFGGDERDVSVLVSNAGPPAARKVSLNVTIEGADAVTVVPPGCEANGPGRFDCTIEEIECGAAAELDFRVRAPACTGCAIPGPVTVTAAVKTVDADLSNNKDSAVENIVCPPGGDLAIDKEDASGSVGPGDVLQYTITARNLGCIGTDATVTDMFPPELTNVLWCRDAGSPCTPNLPPPLQETIFLPAGGSATYRVSGTTPATMCTGTLANTAKVAGPPGFVDVQPDNNSSTVETEIAGSGVKALCKDISGLFVEGGAITYTFVLLNCGPAIQMDNPGDELTDTLPAGLTLTGVAASSGTPSFLGNTAMWNGPIAVGEMVTVTVTATIDLGTTGMTLCNQAMVAFDADGDGVNESNALSDDPNEPGPADPCCFRVPFPAEIPALSLTGLLALALLLAVLAVLGLRGRAL